MPATTSTGSLVFATVIPSAPYPTECTRQNANASQISTPGVENASGGDLGLQDGRRKGFEVFGVWGGGLPIPSPSAQGKAEQNKHPGG